MKIDKQLPVGLSDEEVAVKAATMAQLTLEADALDERLKASLSDHCRYSSMSIKPLPFSSRASKRERSSTSGMLPCSRSRKNAQNSTKSSFLSSLASNASRSAAL
jgi:hypothetical protein